jgi:hypothetical protein
MAEDVPAFEDWLESQDLTAAMKQRFRDARIISDTYKELPLQYIKGCCFCKNEPYTTPKCARGICGRHDVFSVRYGPLFYAFDKWITKLEINGHKVFVKGLTREQMLAAASRLKHFPGANVIENDFSTFEKSVNNHIKDSVEWRFFRKAFMPLLRTAPGLFAAHMLRELMNPKAILGYKWFTILISDGIRLSGDRWTSTGNGITNLCVLLLIAQEVGLCPMLRRVSDLMHLPIDPLVEGDDSVARGRLREADRQLVETTAVRLGFVCKMVVHTVPFASLFCKLRSNPASGEILRDPVEVLVKFPWSKATQVGMCARKKKMLYRAKAMSLAGESPDHPVLSTFAQEVLRWSADVELDTAWLAKQFDSWEYERLLAGIRNYRAREPCVSDLSRELVAVWFGIPAPTQRLIEEELRAGPRGPFFCVPSLFAHVPPLWFELFDRYVVR